MSKKDDQTAPATDAADAAAPEQAVAEKSAAAEDAPAEELTLEQQLEAAVQEAATHRDNYLRMAAELENFRRRSEKKISEVQQYVLADFALAVGEVRDCLEAAVAAAAAENEKTREGVELTLRKLVAAMDARHILPIYPDIGATFDPAIHMAIGQMPATKDAQADTVAAVVQAGYMLNGRVIRAANVMVAVGAPAEAAEAEAAAAEKGGKSAKKKPAKN